MSSQFLFYFEAIFHYTRPLPNYQLCSFKASILTFVCTKLLLSLAHAYPEYDLLWSQNKSDEQRNLNRNTKHSPAFLPIMSDVDMKKPKTEALGDKQAFVDMFPSLVEEIITDVQKSYPDYNAEAVQWLRKVLEYNCPGGLPLKTTFLFLFFFILSSHSLRNNTKKPVMYTAFSFLVHRKNESGTECYCFLPSPCW